MSIKLVNDDSLTDVADAIRIKGELSGTLEFPDGFISAIQNLSPNPTLQSKSVAFTPATTTQTSSVTADSGYDGLSEVDVTVNAIPSQYKDTTDATATADKILQGYTAYANGEKLTGTASGGGGSMKPFVLRSDAELVQEWTYDKWLVEDEGIAIPTYSTSQVTLRAAESYTTDALDLDNYKYFFVGYGGSVPVFSGSAYQSYQTEYSVRCYRAEFMNNLIFYSKDGTQQTTASASSSRSAISFEYRLYRNSNGTVSTDTQSGYGITIQTATASMGSNNKLTLRVIPSITAIGNNTYFPSSLWSRLTDVRNVYHTMLFRCPNGSAIGNGWTMNQLVTSVIDGFAS